MQIVGRTEVMRPTNAPAFQQTSLDERKKVIASRLVGNTVARGVGPKRVDLVGIPERVAHQGELTMIEIGRSLDEAFYVTDPLDLAVEIRVKLGIARSATSS
jgi:hypothetical protein